VRCVVVDSNRVLVRDVALEIPALSALPGELMLGYAPAPGMVRWWKGRHVQAVGFRHGIETGEVPDFCVERPSAPIREDEIDRVLRAMLPPGSRFHLVDFCRMPVPSGQLQFSLGVLVRPPNPLPDSLLMWRGRVIFDKNRSAPFWAKVRISIHRQGVYAAHEIPQGKMIGPEDLRFEVREESLFSAVPETDPQRVSGKRSRRAIEAGAALTDALLVAPRDVNPGEVIEVQVQSGSASLKFNAQAVTGGHDGDQVLLLNQATGKRFKAVIAGKSRAVVSLEDSDDESAIRGSSGLPASLLGSGGRGG
jgi:flagella basal body P-ring formation protein FlgA